METNPPPPGNGGTNQTSAPALSDDSRQGHDPLEKDMGPDDGYEIVSNGRRTRRVKKYFSHQMVTAKGK